LPQYEYYSSPHYFSPRRDDEVIAAASLNYDPAVSAVAERFAAGNTITKKEAEYVATHIPLSHCKLIILFSPGR
jgi:hypothetical protein